MAKGFKHGAGGGSGLNFSVKAYASESALPSVERENTIAVFTDVEISGWIFSATQPTSKEEGIVWFPTGDSSTVQFNALKKNGIEVYPLSAKQYVSGAWVDKAAKSYQGGKWVDWYNGDIVFDRTVQTFESISSNLKECYQSQGSIYAVDADPYVKLTTKSDNGIPRTMQWNVAIDFSKYKTLELVGYGSSAECHFGITDSLKSTSSNYSKIATHAKSDFATTETAHKLDVSSVNITGYIGFYLDAHGSAWIKSIKLV